MTPGAIDVDASFAAFVRQYTSALVRSAYLMTGNSLAAEELVQDTLVSLYPKWERVQQTDAPLAYVRRSMLNQLLNLRRRKSSGEIVTDVLPERGVAFDAADHFGERDEMWRLLATLPERQRVALVLRYFEDLTDEQIAQHLACRVGTVRSLISRGLAALREHSYGNQRREVPPV
jgi:RNA polymerase sigma-70 factor (sigma-E family)